MRGLACVANQAEEEAAGWCHSTAATPSHNKRTSYHGKQTLGARKNVSAYFTKYFVVAALL